MIAALQMYDWPEMRAATDGWWAGIARHLGVDIPLSRPDDFTRPWFSHELLLAQTCGYPFTHALKGQVSYVATPHYDAEGCAGRFLLQHDLRAGGGPARGVSRRRGGGEHARIRCPACWR